MKVRRATPEDSDAIHLVCTGTGNAGADASEDYKEDPKALGRIFTQPYLELEPEFSFVLVDAEDRVVGYTFATPDSERFYERMGGEYLKGVRERFARPSDERKSDWSAVEHMYALYHEWQPHFPPYLARNYPAHLHIDILPEGQGRGEGTKLMARQLRALREAGVGGVHLELASENLRAWRFYRKLGFHEIGRREGSVIMGHRLLKVDEIAWPVRDDARDRARKGAGVCGLLEGFYGRPWHRRERQRLFEVGDTFGMGLYVWAPKDDVEHRAAWRSLHGEKALEELGEAVDDARKVGMEVVYALAPGLDACWSSEADVSAAQGRMRQAAGTGVRRFALLFDDVDPTLQEADRQVFGTPAEAQAAFANAVFADLADLLIVGAQRMTTDHDTSRFLQPDAPGLERFPHFLVCPTVYCSALAAEEEDGFTGGKEYGGEDETTKKDEELTSVSDSSQFVRFSDAGKRRAMMGSEYLFEFGRALLPEVGVLWTGPDVIAREISVEHCREVATRLSGGCGGDLPQISEVWTEETELPRGRFASYPSGAELRSLVLWDNFFANDYDNGRRVYLGPYLNRDAELFSSGVVRGVLLNPNCEAPVNLTPLITLAIWANDPRHYDPTHALDTAITYCTPQWKTVRDPSPLEPRIALETLVHLYYTPFENGPFAKHLLQTIKKSFQLLLSQDPTASSTITNDLFPLLQRVQQTYVHLTELNDRDLCHSLYRFAWDVKEECDILHRIFRSALSSPSPPTPLLQPPPDTSHATPLRTPFHCAGPIRGGILQELRSFTIFSSQTSSYYINDPRQWAH